MNHLVKITYDEDGSKKENPKWCLVMNNTDGPRTLCTGEVFGYGEGSAVYTEKKEERGITCPECISLIKYFKSVKL